MSEGQNKKSTEEKIINEVEPKYIAQKCPVCNGFGTLRYETKTCQGCDGKGYVLVPTFRIEGQNEKTYTDNTIE